MIVGSHFLGDVRGFSNLGGIAGRNGGEIITSYSSGRVTGRNERHDGEVGGLVGANYSSIISSYSIADVRGEDDVGGLVGENTGVITSSYAAGNVTGRWSVGGLASFNRGTIIASYATGDVSGEDYVGGLVGYNLIDGRIITSYATGRVMGRRGVGDELGGLVGVNRSGARIIDSHWDTQSSRQRIGVSDGSTSGATGASTAQMQRPTRYTGIYSGWNVDVDNADGDFDPTTGRDDLWDFGTSGQYPALRVDFDGDGVASWQEFGNQRGNRSDGCPGVAICP